MKVVSMNGSPITAPGEVSKETVERLEDLLERAKSGEVIGFVGVSMDRDETVAYHGAGRIASYQVMGALSGAAMKINELMEEGSD